MEGVAPPDPVAVGPPISVVFRTVTTEEARAAGLRAAWGEVELVSFGGGTWRYAAGTVVGHDYYSPAQTGVPCQLCEMQRGIALPPLQQSLWSRVGRMTATPVGSPSPAASPLGSPFHRGLSQLPSPLGGAPPAPQAGAMPVPTPGWIPPPPMATSLPLATWTGQGTWAGQGPGRPFFAPPPGGAPLGALPPTGWGVSAGLAGRPSVGMGHPQVGMAPMAPPPFMGPPSSAAGMSGRP